MVLDCRGQLDEGGNTAVGEPGKPFDRHLVVIDFVGAGDDRLIDARQSERSVEMDCPMNRSVEHDISSRYRQSPARDLV
ncbi:hypothetical protein D3C87_2134310 [compost metagenome]